MGSQSRASLYLCTVLFSSFLLAALMAVLKAEAKMGAKFELSYAQEDGRYWVKARGRFRGRGLRQGVPYSGPVLTREQLRQCLIRENDINVMSRVIDQESLPLNTATNELEVLAKEVAESDAAVDAYRQESVESHNKLVRQYNSALAEYNATIPEALARVNTKVEKMNATVSRFNSQCADLAYYIHDMEAVEKELGLRHAEPNR